MDLKDTLNESLKGKFRRFNKSNIQTKEECKYFPNYKYELKNIIKERVKEDPECDLNDIWVGDITHMSYLVGVILMEILVDGMLAVLLI